MRKMMPRGVGTFSPPGKPTSGNLLFQYFCWLFLGYPLFSMQIWRFGGSGTPLIHSAPRFRATPRSRCPKRTHMCPKTPLYLAHGDPRSPYYFSIFGFWTWKSIRFLTFWLQAFFGLLGVPAALRNPQKKAFPNFTSFFVG